MFDMVGDLCFWEFLDALRTEKYNSWVANIFAYLKFTRLPQIHPFYESLSDDWAAHSVNTSTFPYSAKGQG
jgi:hypothetical protein